MLRWLQRVSAIVEACVLTVNMKWRAGGGPVRKSSTLDTGDYRSCDHRCQNCIPAVHRGKVENEMKKKELNDLPI